MLAFDRARTHSMSFAIKSADGIGQPFTVSGITKQGDPASPIKYTLSTGMMSHWILSTHPASDIASIQSRNSYNKTPHTPGDRQPPLQILSVEAMDDSVYLATSWDALRRIIDRSEQFQATYGIETAWDSADKTICFTLGSPLVEAEQSSCLLFNVNGNEIQVPFTHRPRLLRTPINDGPAQLDDVCALIETLPLAADKHMPPALLRKAAWGFMLPKLLPRLNLSPLTARQADKVDQLITKRFTEAANYLPTRTPILRLPLRLMGFDYPSVYRLNGKAAIEAVLRALLHHLHPIRRAAEIAMDNWSCIANSCCNPFELPTASSGRQLHPENYQLLPPTARRKIDQAMPTSWHAAAGYLRVAHLSITHTDQSSLLDVKSGHSFHHVLTRIDATNPNSAPMAAYRHLAYTVSSHLKQADYLRNIMQLHRSEGPAADAAEQVLAWYSNLDRKQSLTSYDPSVLIPRPKRRQMIHDAIRGVFTRTSLDLQSHTGTDGSRQIIHGAPSVTAAVVGPWTATFKLTGQHATSGHGELIAMAAALLQPSGPPKTILSDYLGAISAYHRAYGTRPLPGEDTQQPLAETLRMLRDIAHKVDPGHTVTVRHVKAHTDARDTDSQTNDAADKAAKRAHHATLHASHLSLPALTAYMNNYVVYDSTKGYLTDNWAGILDDRLAKSQLHRATPVFQRRIADSDHFLPPAHYYTKSASSFFYREQYQTRTGNFDSPWLQWRKGERSSPACDLCKSPMGDTLHIFQDCSALDAIRQQVANDLAKTYRKPREYDDTEDTESNAPSEDPSARKSAWARYIRSMIRWPEINVQPQGRYWLGIPPRPPAPLGPKDAGRAHEACLTLAGRVAGAFLDLSAEYRLEQIRLTTDATTPTHHHDQEDDDLYHPWNDEHWDESDLDGTILNPVDDTLQTPLLPSRPAISAPPINENERSRTGLTSATTLQESARIARTRTETQRGPPFNTDDNAAARQPTSKPGPSRPRGGNLQRNTPVAKRKATDQADADRETGRSKKRRGESSQ